MSDSTESRTQTPQAVRGLPGPWSLTMGRSLAQNSGLPSWVGRPTPLAPSSLMTRPSRVTRGCALSLSEPPRVHTRMRSHVPRAQAQSQESTPAAPSRGVLKTRTPLLVFGGCWNTVPRRGPRVQTRSPQVCRPESETKASRGHVPSESPAGTPPVSCGFRQRCLACPPVARPCPLPSLHMGPQTPHQRHANPVRPHRSSLRLQRPNFQTASQPEAPGGRGPCWGALFFGLELFFC